MTVVWLVLAAICMFYGRFGTHKIKSEGWGETVFGASQVAMLACLGLAFFSLFDRPAPASASPSGGSEFGQMVTWTIAAIGGPVLLGIVVTSVLRFRRMGKDELSTPELTLAYDRAEGVVHVSERGQMATHRIVAGRLLLELSPYETEGVMRTGLVLRQWPGASSLSPQTAQKAVVEVLRTDVYSTTGKALRAWLNRHADIEFDADVVKLKWQQKVDAMLRHARGQVPSGKTAVESFVAYDGPSLDYLAVMSDGKVFAGTGQETLVEEVARPLVSDGGRRVQVSVGNAYPTFSLTDDDIARLRKLRTKQKVEVIDGRF
jgi:hypothetical protein